MGSEVPYLGTRVGTYYIRTKYRSTPNEIFSFFCHVIDLFVELQHLAKLVYHLLLLATMHNVLRQEANVAAFSSIPNIDHLELRLHPPPSNTTTFNFAKSPTVTWCPQISWISQA
jgi:hypothetical protein